MRSIVDGTTAAMGVEVCSFYLADHERTRLTLAATNGLDRSQVGRVSLAWGEGITGRVAATPATDRRRGRHARRALRVGPRLRHRGARRRCCRCRSSGTTRSSASSTSRPGPSAGSSPTRSTSCRRSARCSPGSSRRAGSRPRSRRGWRSSPRSMPPGRSCCSVVTHELRTPLSIVRVYVDLLAEAAAATAQTPRDWRDAANDQLSRLDRLVDSILASVRGEGLTGLSRAPFDAVAAVDEVVETLRLLLRPHPIRWERPTDPLTADRRRDALPAGPRAAARERVEVRARPRRA